MKFSKLLKFDLINGNFKGTSFIKYIIWVIFSIFICFEARGVFLFYESNLFTLGDYFYYIFGGAEEGLNITGELPYMWMIINLLILYYTLHYTSDDLSGVGQQMILRSHKREYWWMSKCVWNVSCVTIFYLIAWLIISVFAFINGVSKTFELSSAAAYVKNTGFYTCPEVNWELSMEITVMPWLVTVAMSILQMGISMIFKPVFAYIFTVSIYVMSAQRTSPLLFGNYSMAVRSDKVVMNGVNLTDGIIAAILMIAIGIMIGILAIRRYNILSKE